LKDFQAPYLISGTFKGLEVYSKFKLFQGFLKHTMNPVYCHQYWQFYHMTYLLCL